MNKKICVTCDELKEMKEEYIVCQDCWNDTLSFMEELLRQDNNDKRYRSHNGNIFEVKHTID